MLLNLGLILIGIVLVLWGADRLTDGAVAVAQKLKVSQLVIGLTIVAMGTSMPEFSVSMVSALKGTSDLAVGNVVGSNIFNILFVLALSAAIHPISFDLNALIDLGILIAVSLLTYVFAIAKKGVNRVEGGILVSLYIGYMVYIILR